jgi:hypothetical protein
MKLERPARQIIICLALLLVLVGLVLRLMMVRAPFGVVNSDEAIAGLMARGIRDGHFTTFYWGQNYGGSFEVYILASLGLIIPEHLAFFFLPALESIFISFLIFQIAKSRLSREVSFLIAAMYLVFPALAVWNNARPMLFYQSTVLFGLTTIWLLDQRFQIKKIYFWILIGVILGLSWWGSVQSLFFLIPCLIVLLIRQVRPSLRELPMAVLSFFLASLPWWYTNARTGFASLTGGPPRDNTVLNHLESQVKIGWPTAFGLRQPFNGHWLHNSLPILFVSIVVGLVLTYGRHINKTWRSPNPLLLVIPVFIVLQALAPTGSFVGSGRYYIFVVPTILYILGSLFSYLLSKFNSFGTAIVTAIVLVALLSTSLSLIHMRKFQFGPTHLDEVSAVLREHEVSSIYGDYWVVYSLAWEDANLTVSPTTTDRRPDWSAEVRAANSVAYIFWTEYNVDVANLEKTRISLSQSTEVKEIAVGSYVILFPVINIPPEDL